MEASKIFYSSSKNAIFYYYYFSDVVADPDGAKYILWLLTRPENHFQSNQKSVLVLAAVKSFSWQSFKQNYFLREFASGWLLQRQPLKTKKTIIAKLR